MSGAKSKSEKDKGAPKSFYTNPGLREILDRMTLDQKLIVGDLLEHQISEYKRHKQEVDPISLAQNYNLMMDEFVVKKKARLIKSDLKEKVSCRKGCAACCRMHVSISSDEAVLLLTYAKEAKIEIDWGEVERQSGHVLANWKEQPVEDQSCVFLSDKDECSVYEYRPIVCRTLTVFTDPKYCDIVKHPNHIVGRITDVSEEILMSAIGQVAETGSMAKMLLNQK